MSKIIYYLLILPISRLPAPAIYGLSTVFYWLLFRLTGYRRKVVLTNLRNSFPDKNEQEIGQIANEFFRFFCDVTLETIWMFSMSKEQLLKRFRWTNPEVLDPHWEKGQGVVLCGAHYGNWEWAAITLSIISEYRVAGIYKPLKNKFLDQKLKSSRGRFGMELVPHKQTRSFLEENQRERVISIFATDVSPSNSLHAYWMPFLNQDTGVLLGAERYARVYDLPVYFGLVRRIKRGHFTMEIVPVELHPKDSPVGQITRAHTRILEEIIMQEPAYWLWSHKRWKRKKPEGLTEGLAERK